MPDQVALAIETVTGAVEINQIGEVLVHEHLVAASAGMVTGWPTLFGGRDHLVDLAARALAAARDVGVTTIVDATTHDLGRDATLLATASRRSGVRIVAATGHWLSDVAGVAARSVDELAAQFVHDLSRGMDGTDHRAGVIKVASDATPTPLEARVLVAAAMAHRATGAPILTHSSARTRSGLEQAAVLEREGVHPSRVVIGHSDDGNDVAVMAQLAGRGYYLGMDRLPSGRLPEYGPQSVDARLATIVRLHELGYGDRIVIGHDEPVWAGVLSATDQERHRVANPDGLAFYARFCMPRLAALGMPREAIGALTGSNARAWLGGP